MERTRAENRIAKLNECFLSFKSNALENIDKLTATCGELLEATCALYNRLEGGMLCSLGQWNTPSDFNPIDKPDGHICYDVIQRGGKDLFIVRDLQKSSYAQTDPNVKTYNLQTYIGKVVKCGGEFVGSLCVVYQKDFKLSDEDKKIIEIIASAIGVEEERKKAEDALLESEEKFRALAEHSYDTIMRFDHQYRHLYVNPVVEKQTGIPAHNFVGKTHKELGFPEDMVAIWESAIQKVFDTKAPNRIEFQLPSGIWIDWFLIPEFSKSGEVNAVITSARDITAHKKVDEEREKLITDLQKALAKIKTLRGLLPICASCKKIRDDKGYWNQVEVYIKEHSDAEFSHGICPECVKKLYPEPKVGGK